LKFKLKSNQLKLPKRFTQLLPLYHLKGVHTVHNHLPVSIDLASNSYGCSWSFNCFVVPSVCCYKSRVEVWD